MLISTQNPTTNPVDTPIVQTTPSPSQHAAADESPAPTITPEPTIEATVSPEATIDLPPFPSDIPGLPQFPKTGIEQVPPNDADLYDAIGERDDIPVLDVPVAKQDLIGGLFFGDIESEKAYLSETQITELEETVLSNPSVDDQRQYPNRQEFTVDWEYTDDFTDLIPDVEYNTVPLYAVDRDTEVPVFEKVKEITSAFGIGGTTLRMSKSDYATFDMASGDTLMMYDFFKNTFQIPALDILLDNKEEDAAYALEWKLYEMGLLRFPYSANYGNTSDGGKVVRFAPELELPIIRFDVTPAEGSAHDLLGVDEAFPIGISESIDARINSDDRLTELYAFFPNLEKWGDVVLLNKDEIITLLESGEFVYGSAELQHPGALTLEERLEFYEMAESDEVEVTEAELYDVLCGYFQEPEENYQLFYQPVCIAYGQGYVGEYAAEFASVISIAK